jgi:glutamine amidotransferase-like uncharacterized protein
MIRTIRSYVVALLGLCAFAAGPVMGQTTQPTSGKVVRVAIYQDDGSKTAAPNIEKCLKAAPGAFTFRRVTAQEIRDGVLKDFDVVVQGGGSGGGQAKALQEQGRENIKQFVRDGGGYIGICAGAYLATTDYSWSLHLLPAKVVDRAHWARGGGQVKLKMTPDGQKQLGVADEIVECRYNQGPLLAPMAVEGMAPYRALALYESEIAEKGAPKGVMIGTTAFAMTEYGKGRVFVSSPHPEATAGLDGIIRAAVAWAGGAAVPPTTQPTR